MYPSTSADILYQDQIQRKWSPPTMNQPEPLKVFLQHRIRSVIAKEWWDFVVNVNNMNSDHASLLYSVANLCPSFQHFLKSRDKEINYILKKRPVINPRIFSGSERLDVPTVPSPPPKESPPPKKSCSAELEKILNELYPNDKSIIKRNSRLSGPASRQRKTPSKKFQSAHSINGSSLETTESNAITLSNLLRENNSSVTALSTYRSELFNMLPHSKNNGSSSSKENKSKKVEYAVSNIDLNSNKVNNKIKIKKIVKVKRKRYFYTDKFSPIRTYLEDETPELKIEWIKKYKIKKCSVNLKRLSHRFIIDALKPKSMPVIFEAPEVEKSNELTFKNETKSSLSLPANDLGKPLITEKPINSPSTSPIAEKNAPMDAIVLMKPPTPSQSQEDPATVTATNSTVPGCLFVTKADEEKHISEDTCINSSSVSEKASENISTTVKYRSNQKENVDIGEKVKPNELNKDLKTVYYHGGIVPLGKKITANEKSEKTKHYLSLKEKKIKDGVLDSNDSISPLKEKNVLSINAEPKTEVTAALSIIKCAEKNNESLIKTTESTSGESKLEVDDINNSISTEHLDHDKDESQETSPDQVLNDAETTEADVDGTEEEDEEDNEGSLVIDETNDLNDKGSEDATETETIVQDSEESKGLQEEKECIESSSEDVIIIEPSEEVVDLTLSTPEKDRDSSLCIPDKEQNDTPIKIKMEPIDTEDSSLNISTSGKEICSKESNEKEPLIQEIVVISSESEKECDESLGDEPSAKRPRMELNLTEMKIEIKKASTEIETMKNDFHCRLCNETFNSLGDWLSHFDNEVPKCAPNLQVSWDRPEVPMLN